MARDLNLLLSDFERGFAIGARMAASVTKTAQLAGVSIGTLKKICI